MAVELVDIDTTKVWPGEDVSTDTNTWADATGLTNEDLTADITQDTITVDWDALDVVNNLDLSELTNDNLTTDTNVPSIDNEIPSEAIAGLPQVGTQVRQDELATQNYGQYNLADGYDKGALGYIDGVAVGDDLGYVMEVTGYKEATREVDGETTTSGGVTMTEIVEEAYYEPIYRPVGTFTREDETYTGSIHGYNYTSTYDKYSYSALSDADRADMLLDGWYVPGYNEPETTTTVTLVDIDNTEEITVDYDKLDEVVDSTDQSDLDAPMDTSLDTTGDTPPGFDPVELQHTVDGINQGTFASGVTYDTTTGDILVNGEVGQLNDGGDLVVYDSASGTTTIYANKENAEGYGYNIQITENLGDVTGDGVDDFNTYDTSASSSTITYGGTGNTLTVGMDLSEDLLEGFDVDITDYLLGHDEADGFLDNVTDLHVTTNLEEDGTTGSSVYTYTDDKGHTHSDMDTFKVTEGDDSIAGWVFGTSDDTTAFSSTDREYDESGTLVQSAAYTSSKNTYTQLQDDGSYKVTTLDTEDGRWTGELDSTGKLVVALTDPDSEHWWTDDDAAEYHVTNTGDPTVTYDYSVTNTTTVDTYQDRVDKWEQDKTIAETAGIAFTEPEPVRLATDTVTTTNDLNSITTQVTDVMSYKVDTLAWSDPTSWLDNMGLPDIELSYDGGVTTHEGSLGTELLHGIANIFTDDAELLESFAEVGYVVDVAVELYTLYNLGGALVDGYNARQDMINYINDGGGSFTDKEQAILTLADLGTVAELGNMAVEASEDIADVIMIFNDDDLSYNTEDPLGLEAHTSDLADITHISTDDGLTYHQSGLATDGEGGITAVSVDLDSLLDPITLADGKTWEDYGIHDNMTVVTADYIGDAIADALADTLAGSLLPKQEALKELATVRALSSMEVQQEWEDSSPFTRMAGSEGFDAHFPGGLTYRATVALPSDVNDIIGPETFADRQLMDPYETLAGGVMYVGDDLQL